MWHEDKKWANPVGKMALIDLPDTGLPQPFYFKNTDICKHSKAKHNKIRYAYIMQGNCGTSQNKLMLTLWLNMNEAVKSLFQGEQK